MLTDATETEYRSRHRPYGMVEIGNNSLPLALESAIADALSARGRDSDFLITGETPEVAPIIGGRDAPKFKYPWYVLVFYLFYGTNSGYYCGGTVYNERTIITAAHCAERDMEQM